MNVNQALKALKSLGSAQTREIYSRHGVTGAAFGVKSGDLAKLVRRIKVDHPLALALWDSGNHDARVLATMIADPERFTAATLRFWIRAVDNHVLWCSMAAVAGRAPAGRRLMRQWMAAKGEWPAATGWMMSRTPGEEEHREDRSEQEDLRQEDGLSAWNGHLRAPNSFSIMSG